MVNTLKGFTETFWEIEREHDLFNTELNGVFYWQLIRYEVSYEIQKLLGISGVVHSKSLGGNKFLEIPKFIIDSVVYSPFRDGGKYDVMILQSSRKYKVSGSYDDIYTKDIREFFKSTNQTVDVIDPPSSVNLSHIKNGVSNKYIDYLFIKGKFLSFFKNIRASKDELEKISSVSKSIKEKYNVELNLLRIIKVAVKEYHSLYKLFRKLLCKHEYKRIYFVAWRRNLAPLISAAKDLNIKTFEIQHGLIGTYHMNYHFPFEITKRNKIEYFPDYFLAFGKYWLDVCSLPLEESNKIEFGHQHLANTFNGYKHTSKVKKQVLVLSQGVIGVELSKFIYHAAKHNREYNFIFKIHPAKVSTWKEEYKYLVKARYELDNIEVIDDTSIDLYHLLAESEFQMGVSSTALYEGLGFSCKTVLVDLPSVEYTQDLVDMGIAYKVKDPKELKRFLNMSYSDLPNIDYLFKQDLNYNHL